LALAALVVTLGLGSAAHAQASAAACEGKALAKLAQRFSYETQRIQEAVAEGHEKAPAGSPRRVVLDDVYNIHHRAISLESGLRAGLGVKGTEPVFRRLLDGVANARKDAADFPEIAKASSHVEKANALLAEMSSCYVSPGGDTR
jgi:hypothetical protein